MSGDSSMEDCLKDMYEDDNFIEVVIAFLEMRNKYLERHYPVMSPNYNPRDFLRGHLAAFSAIGHTLSSYLYAVNQYRVQGHEDGDE